MKIGKLVRDPALLPKLAKKASVVQQAEHQSRADFLLLRARNALAANPAWKGVDPDEVKDANKDALKTLLTQEVATAAAAVAALRAAMADPVQTELVGIDDASVDPKGRFRKRYMALLARTPQQLRDTAIVSMAWETLAGDFTISPANLHTLVSRRLMIAERMLWYIGGKIGRRWGTTTAGQWNGTDGWERIFEYPRLPIQKPLISSCNLPSGGTICTSPGPMAGWWKSIQFNHDFAIHPTAAALWKPDTVDSYGFFFNNAPGNDPAQAVKLLFTAEDDFRKRNLLMCDHVIHCLHLESLVRVKSKREGNTTWFSTIVNAEADGWLRIFAPFAYDYLKSGGPVFLTGKAEPRFFELKMVEMGELSVGDHVIVYNHPAYDMAMDPDDVWRLENALVVATHPRLLLQGHGTLPLPFSSTREAPVKRGERKLERSMRLNMLGLFNSQLDDLRKLAEDENKKGAKARTNIILPNQTAELVQRSVVGPHSGYGPNDFTPVAALLARWWIRWNPDRGKEEPTISADGAWARWVWEHQKVELLHSHSFFPLWLPRLHENGPNKGKPIRDTAGKIKVVEPVKVLQSMAPGWNWYYDKNESPSNTATHRVNARRPKVV